MTTKPTKYVLATLGLLAVGIGTGPMVFAQDKPAAPPAPRSGAMNDDHMMGEPMQKMMGRMSKMMDQCEKMMERGSDPAKPPDTEPKR
jgi:hypothetical protein